MTKTLTQNNTLHRFYAGLMALMILVGFSSHSHAGQAWEKQDFKVKGTWSIEKRSDGNYIVLDDAFKTKKAPDLKFFLSKKDFQSINGKNATNDAVQVAVLTSAKGAATYKIPAGVNVDDYKSLVLHCEQYSKLWASTPLK